MSGGISINNLSADWVEHAFDKLALPDDNASRLLPAPNGAPRVNPYPSRWGLDAGSRPA